MDWRDFSADGRARFALRAAIVCAATMVGCVVGNGLRFPEIGAAIVFPPYAIVAAALILSRPREWPFHLAAATAGSVAVHGVVGFAPGFVAIAEAANITRALIVAYGVHAFVRRPGRFDSLSAVAWFGLFAVVVAPSVAAFIGAGAVAALSGGDYWLAWRQWALSNAVTGLTLLPLLLAAAEWRDRPKATSRTVREGTLLAAGLLAVSVWVFDVSTGRMLAALYLPVPFLVWVAVRFGSGATSAALAWVAALTIWGAMHGKGPFIAESPTENLLQLQLFLVAMALPVHLLSGLMAQVRSTSAALRDSREQYRSIVEDQTELIFRVLPDGTCTFVNRAYCRYYGRTEADLVGSDLRAIDPSLRSRLAAHRMTPRDATAIRETGERGADGRLRLQEWRDRAFFDDHGRVVELQSVGRDVTEQLRAEEERAELLAQTKVATALREESRKKEELLAVLGDELRDPLTALALVPGALRSVGTDVPRLREIADVVANQVRDLTGRVHDLFEAARSGGRKRAGNGQLKSQGEKRTTTRSVRREPRAAR